MVGINPSFIWYILTALFITSILVGFLIYNLSYLSLSHQIEHLQVFSTNSHNDPFATSAIELLCLFGGNAINTLFVFKQFMDSFIGGVKSLSLKLT